MDLKVADWGLAGRSRDVISDMCSLPLQLQSSVSFGFDGVRIEIVRRSMLLSPVIGFNNFQ